MANVYLIVGLGNPGREYARTRHNAGFMVLEQLGRRWGLTWSKEKRLQAEVAKGQRGIGQCVLGRPLTFMNTSGEAVGAVARFYRVATERLLVVVDDADLPLGTLRLRPSGSSGGHHGLESIEQHLGSQKFARLRVGIGREDPARRQIAGHVLTAFTAAEVPLLEKVIALATDQAECWVDEGPALAMNRFNGTVEQ